MDLVLRALAPQHPDGELPVDQGGLDGTTEARGKVDLTFVGAVLPLVQEVVAGAALRRRAKNRSVPGRTSTVTSLAVTAGKGASTTRAPGVS